MRPMTPAQLIFELGPIQVFYYPTFLELTEGLKNAPTGVYWQDRNARQVHGPFDTTYEAMKHYAYMVSLQKEESKDLGNVIYVDFKAKKKVVLTPSPGGTNV